MDQIGVRELRQNASRFLERVEAGESLEVTDRGRPVAMLVPIVADPWTRLITSGRVTPPAAGGDVADEEPGEYGIDVSECLAALRAEER